MGAPGTGKSTLAHGLFYLIRSQFPYIKTEFVSEFAKDMVWRGEPFLSQGYITSNQFYRMRILQGKVDLVVSDSCLLNGLLYKGTWDNNYIEDLILGLHSHFDNYVIHTGPPPKEYESSGRIQEYEESMEIHRNGIEELRPMSSKMKTILPHFQSAESVLASVIDNGFLDKLLGKTS
jgi:hypothetical protein